MREMRTWLHHLDLLDWVVIIILLVGIAGAIYAQTLRHP
jgi:hypothetical protein